MFRKCKTLQEAKILYRKLSLCLHPDRGGSVELMALLNDIYEEVKLSAWANEILDDHFAGFKAKPRAERKKREKPAPSPVIKKGSKESWELINDLEEFFEKPYFPKEFYNSLKSYLEKNDYLTIKQYDCLRGLCNQFLSKD